MIHSEDLDLHSNPHHPGLNNTQSNRRWKGGAQSPKSRATSTHDLIART